MSKQIILSVCRKIACFAGAPFLLSLAFSPSINSRFLATTQPKANRHNAGNVPNESVI